MAGSYRQCKPDRRNYRIRSTTFPGQTPEHCGQKDRGEKRSIAVRVFPCLALLRPAVVWCRRFVCIKCGVSLLVSCVCHMPAYPAE